ncbi:hypothetical protein [Actinomadura miaoliensis]|uniref:ATP-binding cassette domain-containing protein n=1 Tax=Actinomadura miaoliensis TaxID=430685 RepID=A0ABP7VYI5_9ACTN
MRPIFDLLGFDFLVDELVVALTEPRLLPLTVGLLGDCGAGKSSLLKITQRELESLEKTYVVLPSTRSSARAMTLIHTAPG